MQDASSDETTVSSAAASDRPIVSAAEIEDWLVGYLAELLDIDKEEVTKTTSFERFGLDSAAAVAMTGDLSQWLDVELPPTVAAKHNTVNSLAAYIATTIE